MFFFLIPSLLCVHASFLASHIHFHAHIILIVVVLIFSTISSFCTIATNDAPAICAFPASASSCAAHNACRISVTLLPTLLSTCAVDD
jgi:hypothetical protein